MITKIYGIEDDRNKVQMIRKGLSKVRPYESKNTDLISSVGAEVYHIGDTTALIFLRGEPNPDFWYSARLTFIGTTKNKIDHAVSLLEKTIGVTFR